MAQQQHAWTSSVGAAFDCSLGCEGGEGGRDREGKREREGYSTVVNRVSM